MVEPSLSGATPERSPVPPEAPPAADPSAAGKALLLKRLTRRVLRFGVPLAATVLLAAGGFAIVASAQPDTVEIDLGSPSVFYAMPEITTTLQTTGKRPRYVRLGLAFEVAEADLPQLQAQQPVILDSLQQHLRALTPADLSGEAGAEGLRAALRRRTETSIRPTRVRGVLFTALLVN
jgi:flagellar protein FliL